ncbi:MAG: hypothetical protein LAP21_23385 [Acidobacteriia bacterium]|nr:hypothetical protein [Terriglobia bacterium]
MVTMVLPAGGELEASCAREAGYRNLWKRYLKKRVGHIVAIDFTRREAFDLWNEIREHHQIARGTMSHIRFFIRGLYRWAADRGMHHGENPGNASLPKGLPTKTRQTGAYSLTELNTMLQVFTAPMSQAVLATAFGSAMRKGELAAVKWENIDIQPDGAAVIHIKRSIWQGRMTTPKNEASAGDVTLAPEFVMCLEEWRRACGGPTEGFVFPGISADRPANLDSFARWQLKPMMDRCAICKESKSAHSEHTDHAYQRAIPCRHGKAGTHSVEAMQPNWPARSPRVTASKPLPWPCATPIQG